VSSYFSKDAIRQQPERLILVLLPATVFAFAMGSSSIHAVAVFGLKFRWAMFLLLLLVAVATGWPNRRSIPRWGIATAGVLGVLALLSTAWSVAPLKTAERALTFLAVLVIAAAVAATARRSSDFSTRVLVALLAGPALVAAAGVLVFAFDHSAAVASASGRGGRYRGFVGNPDGAAMLLALVCPIAAWSVDEARNSRFRVAAELTAMLIAGSILFSGSRGAIFAAVAGLIVFGMIRIRARRRLLPVLAALFAVVAIAYAATDVVASHNPAAVKGQSHAQASRGGPFTVELLPNTHSGRSGIPFVSEFDEIGLPGLYQSKPILYYGSGRVFAWIEAIRQGLQRPLLGYGFGTEERVFVDHSYVFRGSFVENSFVGIFLELGISGVLLLAAAFVLAAKVGVRAAQEAAGPERAIIGVGTGVVAAGLVIAFFQSYLYSVGNVGTLTFWVVLFLVLAAHAGRPRERER